MTGISHASPDLDAHYYPAIVIVRRASIVERPLFPYREEGTGGLPGELLLTKDFGYPQYEVLDQPQLPDEAAPYAELMKQVKAGFGRTMSRLPAVFGVSRQTLYNWLQGETPKPDHQLKLQHLAEAAQVFCDLNVRPTSLMLDRVVVDGKSFLQLLASGADGAEMAKKLVRIVQRGSDSRTRLDTLLAGRKVRLTASDIGAPAFDETT